MNYFAAGGLYLILFLLMPLFCDIMADFLVMLDIYDLFKGSFSPPSSEPGGVGRASISAAGFSLKKSIIFDHSGSFKVVVLVVKR